MMLDIYEMEVFLAAAETGSFSEAGRRLQLSQPAVSMQIRSLERRLGVDLFHRSGRHIDLTEIGQALVPMARDLVSHAAQVRENVAAMQGAVVGVLRIACSTTAGKYVLPKLIGGFIERFPAVQVDCQVVGRDSALQMVIQGEAQVAISSLREPSRDLEYRQFITDPVVLIAPPGHPWAAQGSIETADLPAGRFIRREIDSGTQQTVIEALAEHDLSPNDLPTVMILGNSEAIYMAVAEGIGVAFVSYRAAAEGIAAGRVVEIPVRGLNMTQQLYMVRHTVRHASAVQSAFWDYVYAPENRPLLTQHSSRPALSLAE